jgi:Co/Zn/Cd efflux system component
VNGLKNRSSMRPRAILSFAAACAVGVVGVRSGSAAAQAEVMHLLLDAAVHAVVLQGFLAWLWECAVPADCLAFGPVRLHVLFRLVTVVCATGGALFIGLDSLLEFLLPGVHAAHHQAHHHSHSHDKLRETDIGGAGTAGAPGVHDHSVVVPWLAGGVSALLSALLALLDDQAGPIACRRWASVRAGSLLLCAYLGATPLGRSNDDAIAPPLVKLPPTLPPLLSAILVLLIRRPDASVGALLAALAIRRGVAEAAMPVRLLLQMAPPTELVPDLPQRLARARAAPGLLELRDVQLWASDELSATGSVVAVVRAVADTQRVQRHVRAALEGGAISAVTISVERDDDDGWGDSCCDASFLSFTRPVDAGPRHVAGSLPQ